jgi:serine/threonine protein kinase
LDNKNGGTGGLNSISSRKDKNRNVKELIGRIDKEGGDAPNKCKLYSPGSDAELSYNVDVDSIGKIKRIGKNDFKILKLIGKGSYGKVYLVEKLMGDQNQA